MKANHNLRHKIINFIGAVFNKSKIQIWKRITTSVKVDNAAFALYLISQRYKFESESQRPVVSLDLIRAVFNKSKIQIWKRITTPKFSLCFLWLLYLISQRYKFESESQLLKNSEEKKTAVFNKSKIQIWKRITTKTGKNTIM